MPLTLSKEAYCSVMVTKEETAAQAGAHHDRMAAYAATLLAAHPGRGLFGAIDVGESCYWWDYGQLKLYQKNNMLAMDDSEEAEVRPLTHPAVPGAHNTIRSLFTREHSTAVDKVC